MAKRPAGGARVQLLVLVLTTLVWGICTATACVVVLAMAVVRFAARPIPGGRRAVTEAMIGTMNRWTDLNRRVLLRGGGRRWTVRLPDDLRLDEWCVVIANHQAWADIFVIADLFNRRLPFIRWFMKRELMWVPLIGAVWWVMDFPFLRRYSRADLEAHPEKRGEDRRRIRESCARLLDAPATVMVFPEGTRFTPAKHTRRPSGFDRLLRPRVGGLATALDGLGARRPAVVDVTLFYVGERPSMVDLLRGWRGDVIVEVTRVPFEALPPVTGDPEQDRARLGAWLEARWAAKDTRLAALADSAGDRTVPPRR